MSSLGNFFPKVQDPIVLNDFFTINDCLQDDDSFLSGNSFDDPLIQIDCIYSSAAEFKSFPKTNDTYNFSTFCLNIRSLCNFKNLDNLKCVLESMNSYPTTIGITETRLKKILAIPAQIYQIMRFFRNVD